MRALPSVRDWRRCVATDLLPHLHGHQSNALADSRYAIALAGPRQAGQVAAPVPTPATRASARRRFARLLAHDRLLPALAQTAVARALLAPWAGLTIRWILDAAPKANARRAWGVRLAHARRALPRAPVCYRFGALPKPLPALGRARRAPVLATRPTDTTGVLLAERGLAGPALVDGCQAHGGHSVLRVQGPTHVRSPDGRERPVRERAAAVGQRWLGEAEGFKKAGGRGAHVVATWERGMQAPWRVRTDQEASLRHGRVYGQRRWAEASFRDDQGTGFPWEKSQGHDPEDALRLRLVLALALGLAARQGTGAQETGRRGDLGPHRCRRLSLIPLGLRGLRYGIEHRPYHLLHLDRVYLRPK